MIRWKGIAVFAGIIVFVFVLSLFLTDQWLENRLEDAGSSLVGAKVEIDGLDIEILDMYMGLNHLQITDPKHTMKNIVETGPIKMDIEFWPLLTGKIIVEEVTNFPNFLIAKKSSGELITTVLLFRHWMEHHWQ